MQTVSVLDISAPEAAVLAGSKAACGLDRNPDYLLHSYTHYQGIAMWPAGCWVAKQIYGEHSAVVPFELSAYSNSAIFSLITAGRLIGGNPDTPGSALLTSGDRFQEPWVDRWTLSSGMVFGDGGSAMAVSNSAGGLRLLSASVRADVGIADLFRGNQEFSGAPIPVDMRSRNREYFRSGSMTPADVRARAAAGLKAVVAEALRDAEASENDIDWVITPFVGKRMFEESFVEPLWDFSDRSPWEFGLNYGHLGPGDQVFGLVHLRDSGLLDSGDRILLIGTGYGFTFAAAVVQA